jgi:transposase
MDRSEIISRVERRRRWTSEQKLKILAEVLEPGAAVSAVADRNGISRSQVYAWKRLAQQGGIPGIYLNGPPKQLFAPVRIEGMPPASAPAMAAPATTHPQRRGSVIEVALTNGRIVRVDEGIEPVRLAQLVAALDGTRS